MNSPVVQQPTELLQKKKIHASSPPDHVKPGRHVTSKRNNKNPEMTNTDGHGRSSVTSTDATFLLSPKEKSSHKIPSKQQRKVSRSLKYDSQSPIPHHQEVQLSGGLYDDKEFYNGSEDGAQPAISDVYSQSTISSAADDIANCGFVQEDAAIRRHPASSVNPIPNKLDVPLLPAGEIFKLDFNGNPVPNDQNHGTLDSLVPAEDMFQRDFTGIQSSPRNNEEEEEKTTDELIAEVLAELSEEEAAMCEADMQSSCDARMMEEELKSSMESEGLLLRKHELENYAIRARDRSVIVIEGSLWFVVCYDLSDVIF